MISRIAMCKSMKSGCVGLSGAHEQEKRRRGSGRLEK